MSQGQAEGEPIQIARGAVAEIAERFPQLAMVESPQPLIDLDITLPVQPGLKQEVRLGLDGDELHFSVSHFHIEWFPCTESDRVRSYVETVCGYLSGSSRVLEHYRGEACVKAELQVPDGERWKTLGTWSRLRFPYPLNKTYRVVSNT